MPCVRIDSIPLYKKSTIENSAYLRKKVRFLEKRFGRKAERLLISPKAFAKNTLHAVLVVLFIKYILIGSLKV